MKRRNAIIVCFIISLIFTLTACVNNDNDLDVESGVYTAQNILMKRDVLGSPTLDDEWYVDNNETEDFLIDRLTITVEEGGKEGEYETFRVKKKIYAISIEVVAQGEKYDVLYVGAECDEDKRLRIGFETKDFYIRIFGYMKSGGDGRDHIEATIGYGRSQNHTVQGVKLFKQ